MRLFIGLLATGSVSIFAHKICAQEEREEPLYRTWLEVGAAFPQSTELHSFPGVTGDSKIKFQPGMRFGLGSGYSFTPYFALDWEIAVIGSSIDEASGLTEIDAMVTQVPFLVNATFQYQNRTGITPFLGAGIGGSSSAINVDEARSSTATLEDSDYDFVFAWQGIGGVKYELRNGLALGVAYKYIWTGDAQWELEDDVTGVGYTIRMGGVRSHSLLAFVSYRF